MTTRSTRAARISTFSNPEQGRYTIQKCCNLRERRTRLICVEAAAAQTMRALTSRYGARGKSAKAVFLQGIRHGLRGMSLASSSVEDANFSQSAGRPAAMVTHSRFVKRLETLIRNQTFHVGPLPSVLEAPELYDEAGNLQYDPDECKEPLTPANLQQQEPLILLRHKIFQRALGALILQFEAYKPLLKFIKQSYDSAIRMKEKELLELSWTAQCIQAAYRDLMRKGKKVSFEGIKVQELLTQQCNILTKHIENQDAALQLISVILENLETTLGDEHEQRKDSDDQNVMLTHSINAIRIRLGLPPRPVTPEFVTPTTEDATDDSDEEDSSSEIIQPFTTNDPMILRRALDICNYDLQEENKRMQVMEEEHKDEVPRRKYVEAQQEIETAKRESEEFAKKALETQEELENTKELVKKYTQERDDLKKKVEEIRGKLTPRPSWDKVGEFVDGGIPRWRTIYEGKSSAVTANRLIEELKQKKEHAPISYLAGMGTGPDVPRCLRFEGKVRDRKLSRRDAEYVVNDIWKERMQMMARLDADEPTVDLDDDDPFSFKTDTKKMSDFPEYVALYLDEKFPDADSFKLTWIYNIVDTCRRISTSRQLQQFASSLFLQLEERCYYIFREEFLTLRELLWASCTNRLVPEINLVDYKKVLKTCYPNKSAESFKKLTRITSKQCKAHADWSPVKFDSLFVETDQGFRGPFFEEFYDQMEAERMQFIKEVLQHLATSLGTAFDFDQENDFGGETPVHIFKFKDALHFVEPQLSEDDLAATIAWVYFKVSILPPLEEIRHAIFVYLDSQAHDAIVQSNTYDHVVNTIRSFFGKEPDVRDKRNAAAAAPPQPPKEIKFRTLVRRMKAAALWRPSSLSKTNFDRASLLHANEYGGEDFYEMEAYELTAVDEDEDEEEDEEEEV